MQSRGILNETIHQILNEPDTIQSQDENTTIYSKLVEEDSKTYLYRVFVNTTKVPALVITVYKTSKIEKYGH